METIRITENLLDIIENYAIIDETIDGIDDLDPSKKLSDELGLDSVDMVDIVLTIEERFLIEFGDDEIKKAETLNDLILLIQEKVG